MQVTFCHAANIHFTGFSVDDLGTRCHNRDTCQATQCLLLWVNLLHAELTELLTLLGSPFFLSTISVTSHEAHLLELMAAMTVSKDWPSALRSTSAPQ